MDEFLVDDVRSFSTFFFLRAVLNLETIRDRNDRRRRTTAVTAAAIAAAVTAVSATATFRTTRAAGAAPTSDATWGDARTARCGYFAGGVR